MSLSAFLTFAHMIGLGLAVGAATAKLTLVLTCRTRRALLPVYFEVSGLLTRQIIGGMVLLILSGLGWIGYGYAFTPLLVVKTILVAGVFGLGVLIDNVVEPHFRRLAPMAGEPVSPAFLHAERRFVAVETIATLLFYVIIFIWVRG